MEVFLDFLMALFAAFGIVCVLWYIGCALNPPPQKGEKITAVVSVRGDARELSKNVDALQRMKRYGYQNMQIVVADDGMDPEAASMAAEMAESGEICLCGLWEIFRK